MGTTLVENPDAAIYQGRRIKVAHFLSERNANVLLAGILKEGSFHVLGDNPVEIYEVTKPATVRKAIDRLRSSRLEVLRSHQGYDE